MLIQDETLLNISLVITILGLSILAVLSYYQKIPQYDLNELTKEKVGEKIEINGLVVSSKNSNYSTQIRIKNSCYTDLYVDKNVNLSVNSSINVKGIIEEYNGKISIRVDSLRINSIERESVKLK